MNPRYFPLQKRRIRRLWHLSEFKGHSGHVYVEIPESETDYIYGNFTRVRAETTHLQVDPLAKITQEYDPARKMYRYHVPIKGPRISAKIRKLYET